MRTLALGWTAFALLAAIALALEGAADVSVPEAVHVAGHLVLCGVASGLLAASASRALPGRTVLAVAGAWAMGLAIEVVQAAIGGLALREAIYDLGVDGVGAALGVAAWSTPEEERREAVGHVLSAALHPLALFPIGFAGLLYAAQRSAGSALLWTGLAMLSVVPSIGLWLAGILRGWWTDKDLSRRSDRPLLFVVGCVGILVFAGATLLAPSPLPALGGMGLLAAAIGTLVTRVGLKISGHVTIPATLGLAIGAWSWRGPVLLLGSALILSWARVVAGRHQLVEVGAGWALALFVALGLRLLG